VDQEVHATAGREAGATGSPALQVRDPSTLSKQSEIDTTPTGKLLSIRIRMEDVSRSTAFEEPESRQRISNFTSD
jgi:hypothetical protein